MTILDFGQLTDTPVESDGCIGVYFRYTENNYFVKGRLIFQKQLSMLKKRSCSGCDTCGWILDDAQNGISDFGEEFFEFPPTLRHGDIVELGFIVDSTDWETGYVDAYHIKVIKVHDPAE